MMTRPIMPQSTACRPSSRFFSSPAPRTNSKIPQANTTNATPLISKISGLTIWFTIPVRKVLRTLILRARPTLLTYLEASLGRPARRARVIAELDGTHQDVHEAPERNHNEEADKTPEHECLPLFLSGIIPRSQNEGLEDTIEEDDEGHRKEDRHKHIVDDVDYEGASVREVVDGGEGDEGQGKSGDCSRDGQTRG